MRKGDIIPVLGHYNIIRRWALRHYDLRAQDFDLLLYLYDLDYFTHQQFVDGQLLFNWDKNRMARIRKDGWIEMFHKSTGKGDHSKNKLTIKGRRMVTGIYKILYGWESIPEYNIRKLAEKEDARYSDKVLWQAIKKFNRGKI